MNIKLLMSIIVGVGIIMIVQKSNSEPTLIPRKVLFGNPEKASVSISPNGHYLSYLAESNGVLNVWIEPVAGGKARVVTHDTERPIRNYFWSHDSQSIYYLQDIKGDEDWRLYKTSLATGSTEIITPFEKVHVTLAAYDKNVPDRMILAINKDNPQLHDLYEYNEKTGQLQMFEKNPGDAGDFIIDNQFNVRGYVKELGDGSKSIMMRDTHTGKWQELLHWAAEDVFASNPFTFSKDGRYLYCADSTGVNSAQLVKINVDTKEREVIASDPVYDVQSAVFHPDTYELLSATWIKERKERRAFTAEMQKDYDFLATVDKGDFSVNSFSDDFMQWIVAYLKDDGPISYYLYDRTTHKVRFLFVNRPELQKYELAPMEPITVTARDGLVLHGYMTTPLKKEKKNLPTVLFVHGGPWARDEWSLNSYAQLFANRGYAVVQINFRGSTGYGKVFLNAGIKQWSKAMHDDLLDTVNWAIEKGISDPKKVAIFGGSYGGYAALVGATFTPDVFCCAVDVVGPSNVSTLIRSVPPYWALFLSKLYIHVGNPDTEKEYLDSISPLFKVDAIKIPLLIAQGAHDPRVKQVESEQIVAAMKERGIPHEYMLFPDEGHGFAKPENSLKFVAAMEKFFSQYLGGRCEQ